MQGSQGEAPEPWLRVQDHDIETVDRVKKQVIMRKVHDGLTAALPSSDLPKFAKNSDLKINAPWSERRATIRNSSSLWYAKKFSRR